MYDYHLSSLEQNAQAPSRQAKTACPCDDYSQELSLVVSPDKHKTGPAGRACPPEGTGL